MTTQEILPALVRQKVKFYGETYDMLSIVDTKVFISRTNEDGRVATLFVDAFYCEPVPEETRPLKVGDRVKCKYPLGDHYVFGIITAILHSFGDVSLERKIHVGGSTFHDYDVCHATPEEEARYFN